MYMCNKRAMPRIMARAAKQSKFEFEDANFFTQPSAGNGAVSCHQSPAIYDEIAKEIGTNMFVHSALGKVLFRRSEEMAESRQPNGANVAARDGIVSPHCALDNQPNGGTLAPPMPPVILPGIADDVECYPCRACAEERVFLTRAGLEKHAAEQHPERLADLVGIAQHIQNVWANRRWRKQAETAPTPTAAAVCFGGGDGALSEQIGPKSDVSSTQILQECTRCGALFDARCRAEMFDHLAQHQRNDRVRAELGAAYGTQMVQRLCCEQCDLVYPDSMRLADHRCTGADHVKHQQQQPVVEQHCIHEHHRRRRYMCHWCARMFDGIAELNMHKQLAHRGIGMRAATMPDLVSGDDDDDEQDGGTADGEGNSGGSSGGSAPGPSMAQQQLRRDCVQQPLVGIGTDAPANNYEAKVTYPLWPSVPTLRYAVDDGGQLIWLCCEHKFGDKASLLNHRATVHNMMPSSTTSTAAAAAVATPKWVKRLPTMAKQRGIAAGVVVVDGCGQLLTVMGSGDQHQQGSQQLHLHHRQHHAAAVQRPANAINDHHRRLSPPATLILRRGAENVQNQQQQHHLLPPADVRGRLIDGGVTLSQQQAAALHSTQQRIGRHGATSTAPCVGDEAGDGISNDALDNTFFNIPIDPVLF
uniref:C2H2-type domain-containing protein n=1 Tax=Globodera rostochiensis TaxID=31243 RepID=A0A914HPZ8_GLORO